MVQVPGVGGREPRIIARRMLGEIIEPRMEEIFAMAQRELIRSGVADSLASGLVLVGGTSLLEGTQELAERVFNLPVRRGLPIESQRNAGRTDEADVHHRRGPAAVPGRHRAAIGFGSARSRKVGRLRARVTRLGQRFF